MEKIAYDYDIELIEWEIPSDPIYIVVRTEPKISPSYVMQAITSLSAKAFFKLPSEIKYKYFWDGKL